MDKNDTPHPEGVSHRMGAWARQLDAILEIWGLEQDWEAIQQKPFMEWKRLVALAAEKRNIVKLRQECDLRHYAERGNKEEKNYICT